MRNTITQAEANAFAESYTQDAATSVVPAPRLELLSRFEDSPCDDPTDHGPRGRVFASRTYWLRDVPKERNPEIVNDLVRWWQAHNFRITTDKRPENNIVAVQHNETAFTMSVKESPEGNLSLGASSPCVWPNGTPDPKPGSP